MSNFEINVEMDGRTNGRTNGKGDAYVAKSGGRSGRCFMQGLMVDDSCR